MNAGAPADSSGAPPLANLVLIGPMGAGKSSIARELALLTGFACEDTDRIVRRLAGLSIPEIFARHGEPRFRELERDALQSLRERKGVIIATGGGIVAPEENRVLLRSLGVVVWLTAREDVLFQRVSRNRQRPLLHTADPRGTLRGLLAAREGFYRSCAHLTVDTSDETHAQVAHAVLRAAHTVLAARTTPAGAELAAP